MHQIEPNKQSLHGYFSRDLPPILEIASGETVRYTLLDAAWKHYDAASDTLVQSPLREADPLKGHGLCGPIAISGAKKGMTLEVQVGAVQVAGKGWNVGGGKLDWAHWQRLGVAEGERYEVLWTLDAAAGTATNALGHKIALAPFLGVMGMPPDEAGNHGTDPPRFCGGNMDCKLLTAGSRVFLPIAVDGGLFSTGDGHAVQSDGEASGTAIECPIEQVDLTFVLHPDMHLTAPRAETPSGWITLGFHQDLDEAMYIALNAMLDLLMERLNITRQDALSLSSLVVDLHITQVVNGVQGVHALLPHGAIMTG